MSEAGVALKVTVALRFLLSYSTYAIKNCILPTGLLETVECGASARNTLLKFVHFYVREAVKTKLIEMKF